MNGNFSKLTRDNEARNYFSKLEFILKCKVQLQSGRDSLNYLIDVLLLF